MQHLGWIYAEDDGLVVKCIARPDGTRDTADVFYSFKTAEEAIEFADKRYGHLFEGGRTLLKQDLPFLGYQIINPKDVH